MYNKNALKYLIKKRLYVIFIYIYIKKKVIEMNFQERNFMYKFCVYIILFLFTFSIILLGTAVFYNNFRNRKDVVTSNSDYTKLNLYFLKATKNPGVKINSYGLVGEDLQSYFITFENTDGVENTFIKLNDIIYYNKIKLCENVDNFKVIVDKTGKESISVEVKIQGKTYLSQYVIE